MYVMEKEKNDDDYTFYLENKNRHNRLILKYFFDHKRKWPDLCLKSMVSILKPIYLNSALNPEDNVFLNNRFYGVYKTAKF